MTTDNQTRICSFARLGERGMSNGVLAVVGGVGVLAAVVALVYLIATLGDGDSGRDERRADVYVSLGDSVAFGSGASDPATTSFPALLAAADGISLLNLAEAGATTQDVIDNQVVRALVPVSAGRVRYVTISAGGNDLAALIPNATCTIDPLPDTCPLAEALAGVERNTRIIIDHLRDAAPRLPIVLLAYPNFFSGSGHVFEAPATRVLPRLGEMLDRVANDYERIAVGHPTFDGRSDELTHVLDLVFDPHPNDAGHRVIANALADALDVARSD